MSMLTFYHFSVYLVMLAWLISNRDKTSEVTRDTPHSQITTGLPKAHGYVYIYNKHLLTANLSSFTDPVAMFLTNISSISCSICETQRLCYLCK